VLFFFLNIREVDSVSAMQENTLLQENLENTKYSLENEINNIRSILNQLSNATYVEELLRLSDSTKRNDEINPMLNYAASNCVVELRKVKNTSKYFTETGIFLKQSGIVIDIKSTYPAADFFRNNFSMEGIEVSRWFGIADSFQSFYMLPSDKINYENQEFDGYTFIKTIPSTAINTKGFIFIVLKKDFIEDIIHSLDLDTLTSGILLDNKNKLLASSSNFNNIPLPAYSRMEPINATVQTDEKFSFFPAQIKNLPWKLVLIRNNSLNNLFSHLGVTLLFILFAIFIMGIFVSEILKKQYEVSIDAVIGSIGLESPNEPFSLWRYINYKHIYRAFEHKYKNLLDETNLLTENIGHSEGLLKELAIIALMRPVKASEEYNEAVENDPRLVETPLIRENFFSESRRYKLYTSIQNKMFESSQAFIFCLYIHNKHNNGNSIKCSNDFKEIITKQDLKFQSIHALDFFKAYLIFLNDTQAGQYQVLCDRLLYSRKELEARYDLEIYVELSPLFSSIDGLVSSYQTLAEHMKIRKYSGTNDILLSSDTIAYFPLSKEALIHRLLKAGTFDKAETIIRDALKCCTPLESEMVFNELLAIAIRYAEDEKLDLNNFAMDYRQLKSFGDILSLMKQLSAVGISNKKTEGNNYLTAPQKENILQYINDNYLDSNLSLKIIGDEFNVSLSLVTKTVKELTNDSFLNYLSRKRISYAKNLLNSPDMTITKARNLSGFNDDSVFIKVFKKYEGMTPGEYKKRTVKP
jgi:AraC-like DNA-binding protein